MSVDVHTYGTGDKDTICVSVCAHREGEYIRIGTMIVRIDEIPELIEQLSEWVDETE